MFAPPIQRLIAEFAKLPGIGQRTAQRLALHVLRGSDEHASQLASAIAEVKAQIRPCQICFNLADQPTCHICRDARRDDSVICVVEDPADVISMERTHEFHGRYHVLGGSLSPLDGVDPEDLRLPELFRRLRDGQVGELIVATNPTTSGEATALHVAREVRELAPSVRVTRLAAGLSVGADLEYTDEVTLGRALLGRREL
ncbi:MAG: recombination mediator RecR [Solirubrobacteraceae bacterium]|nr:recombination mediator RecR [Solirubrobacteraceae bacterium]